MKGGLLLNIVVGQSSAALPPSAGPEVQLRQDDLQEVLRQAPPQGHQLQEEGLWPHLPAETQEEAEVSRTPILPTYAAILPFEKFLVVHDFFRVCECRSSSRPFLVMNKSILNKGN